MENNNWIDTKEQMPPNGKNVLLYYKNEVNKNRFVIGRYVSKFTDDDVDMESEWHDYDEKTDTYYLPAGWYENIENYEDYGSFYMSCQDILFWMDLPKAPNIKGIESDK